MSVTSVTGAVPWRRFSERRFSARQAVAMRALAALALALLAGCSQMQRLSEVGSPPKMTRPSDPTADPAYKPVTLPMPRQQLAEPEANSLWRPGSRAFFKDQRAAQVGDIITVLVNIADTASVTNQSSAARTGTEALGVPNMFGLEAALPRMITAAIDPKNLVNASSSGGSTGTGSIARNEAVTLRLAGVITQVLANGNLVVSASQEMLVNSELRELKVNGVIRPQDIASDNTVSHDRMAEARIQYGGRGQLSDLQTPRVGQQILDVLLPF
jgi:flagellar L-ring protein precursor FlgH